MRRFLIVSSYVLGVVLVVGVVLWGYIGGTGSTKLEQWIGNQIVDVLENYITPEVQFTSLDYQAPKTVVVEGLVLSAADSRIVELERMQLALAEIPRRGRPIQIEQISIAGGRLLFRSTGRGFVGWSGFVNAQAVKEPESVPQGRRFSDVLVLRRVQQTQPRYAGILSSQGNAYGRLAALPQSLSGGGKVAIRKGHLVNLPVIKQIVAMLAKSGLGAQREPRDKADVNFSLASAGLRVEQAEIVSAVVVMRGSGLIGYDSSLDLLVNAGLLEKLQSSLGSVGDIFGKITDRTAGYTVKGTIENPEIGVRAFGIGR